MSIEMSNRFTAWFLILVIGIGIGYAWRFTQVQQKSHEVFKAGAEAGATAALCDIFIEAQSGRKFIYRGYHVIPRADGAVLLRKDKK